MTDAQEADASEDFTTEAKYKQFSYEVEKALRNFELSTEWPDLISALTRLNKVTWQLINNPGVGLRTAFYFILFLFKTLAH